MAAQPNIDVQDRDLSFLFGLFECRIMTAEHVGALYFSGKHPYAIKRIRKLKVAGFVGERQRQVNKPSILFLTRKGFKLLQGRGHLADYPALSADSFEARANVSELTLRHEIAVMDVKAAFHTALEESEKFSLESFSTWPRLYQFETTEATHGADKPMRPDGFIRVHETEAGGKGFYHECFLEIDRSGESQDILVSKAVRYMDYYKSGGFAVWNGAPRSEFKDYHFRVLFILKSHDRRNNLAERLAQNNPPIFRQAWLTTFAEVTANPTGKIWVLPVDYRNVARGTRFYSEVPSRQFKYRRQPEREAFIEEKIKKWGLFETPSA
jgi:hypothetical protein